MGCNGVWLASRNAIRNTQRAAARQADEAAGRRPRRVFDGRGRQRSRENFSKRRSRERMLARLRKMRRPFVKGKQRLWGKGPAPPCYAQKVAPIFAPAGLEKRRLRGKGPALRCFAPKLLGEREEREDKEQAETSRRRTGSQLSDDQQGTREGWGQPPPRKHNYHYASG